MKSFLIILLLILYGCSKDGLVVPINPPVVITVKSSVVVINTDSNVTVTPGDKKVIVDLGSTLNLVMTPKTGYSLDSISINGKLFPLVSNTYTIPITSQDTIFVKIFTKKEIVIPTRQDTLRMVTWKYVKSETLLPGSDWEEYNISPENLIFEEKTFHFIYPNGKTLYNYYTFDGITLVMAGREFKVIYLSLIKNDQALIIVTQSPYQGGISYFRDTYIPLVE